MKILLDTHCWLWMQVSPSRLSPTTQELLSNPDHELYLSAASSWEISIKWALGKLPLPVDPPDYIPRCMERQGVLGLPVQHRHALHVSGLPRYHEDPFDRLLVAQAQLEKLTLLTADRRLGDYEGMEIQWA